MVPAQGLQHNGFEVRIASYPDLINVIRSRKERQRAARENLILEHAARLLAQDGFQDLNLDDLAKAVEYSKGTLYLHFKTKEDLALAVATRALGQWADLLERAASFPGSTRARARAMGVVCAEFLVAYRELFTLKLVLQERSFWDRVSQERRSQHLAEGARTVRTVNQVVLDAVACGNLPGGCSSKEVALSLMAISIGGHCFVTHPAWQRLCPMEDPGALLLQHQDRLLDGWGWKPLSERSTS